MSPKTPIKSNNLDFSSVDGLGEKLDLIIALQAVQQVAPEERVDRLLELGLSNRVISLVARTTPNAVAIRRCRQKKNGKSDGAAVGN
jgi:hypothetical protein